MRQRRIDAFELWCWRRLLRVSWTARRSSQSIRKEIRIFIGNAKIKDPILLPPHVKSWLIGKNSDGWKDWGQEEKGMIRGWDGWMVSRTQWTWVWANSRWWWRIGKPGMLQSTGSQKSQIGLSNWTATTLQSTGFRIRGSPRILGYPMSTEHCVWAISWISFL